MGGIATHVTGGCQQPVTRHYSRRFGRDQQWVRD